MNGVARVRHANCRATPSPHSQEDGDEGVSLSPRQLQVLLEVDNGASNKHIARDLGVTEHTVKFHLSKIYRKLSARRRTEALKAARSQGLIEGES